MDCQILQDDLNSLAQWETDWQMKFNVAKCHSMRVTRHPPDKHIQFDYTLHQQRLEKVQSAKYLGITISDYLDWGQHISEIPSKATKTLGFLWGNLTFAPRDTKEVAYKTLVCPKLEYAAPIWHPYHETEIGQVEKVQKTAARWTCRRWRNTKFFTLSKISFNKRYLLHTYDLLYLYCYRTKKERTDPGAPPWTELTLNSPSVCAGNLTKDSHVTAQTCH